MYIFLSAPRSCKSLLLPRHQPKPFMPFCCHPSLPRASHILIWSFYEYLTRVQITHLVMCKFVQPPTACPFPWSRKLPAYILPVTYTLNLTLMSHNRFNYISIGFGLLVFFGIKQDRKISGSNVSKQLCNVNKQHTHFLNSCFNSTLHYPYCCTMHFIESL